MNKVAIDRLVKIDTHLALAIAMLKALDGDEDNLIYGLGHSQKDIILYMLDKCEDSLGMVAEMYKCEQ